MRDIIGAFGIALLANVAVLVVAASTFHNVGLVILTLQDAHALMEQVTFVFSFVISCKIRFKQYYDPSWYFCNALYISQTICCLFFWWATKQSGFGLVTDIE
jgi:hypothetical protein